MRKVTCEFTHTLSQAKKAAKNGRVMDLRALSEKCTEIYAVSLKI